MNPHDMRTSDESLALVPNKQRDLATTFVDAINANHTAGLACDNGLREIVAKKIAITVATGELIRDAQMTFGSLFEGLVGRNLSFSQRALRGYTVIAKRHRANPDFRSQW